MSKVLKDDKGRTILDEDNYVECLEHIIERDFFPDLNELRKQSGCLSGDKTPQVSQSINRIDLSKEGFDTPMLSGLGQLSTPARDETKQSLSAPIKADATLDRFLHKHTSEDNASYSEIVQEEVARMEEKGAELYCPALEYKPDLQAVGYFEKPREVLAKPDLWTFKVRNALIYQPEAREMKEKDNPNANRQVIHTNTRLTTEALEQSLTKQKVVVQRKDQIGPDGKPLDGGGTPRVKGYAYCATPSIEPGVDASPLMTWGTIESTPERVESAPATPGRAFRMPKVPMKERLGLALADKCNKSYKNRHGKAMSAMKKLANSAGLSPSPRLSHLSPAARRLALATSSRSSSHRSIFSTPTPSSTKTPTPRSWATPGSEKGWSPATTPKTPGTPMTPGASGTPR